MQQSGGVNRCHRAAELQPDACRFGGVEAMFAFQQPLERLALHQLHPEPDLIVDLRGAVDGDHVRMADACEHPPFLDDAAPAIRVRRRRRQQLQRHLPVETRGPRRDRPSPAPRVPGLRGSPRWPHRVRMFTKTTGIGRCRANVNRRARPRDADAPIVRGDAAAESPVATPRRRTLRGHSSPRQRHRGPPPPPARGGQAWSRPIRSASFINARAAAFRAASALGFPSASASSSYRSSPSRGAR